jgi:ubiquinone/menaquinone biosynthesis C-methylase UbiE
MKAQTHAEIARSCKQSDWGRQFSRPTGWRGRLVGHLMAAKNAGISRLAVELLDVQPDDRLLEIGFGPGKGIHEAARHVSRGFIAGVDRSEVMLRQAERRNRWFIAEGRVELHRGSVGELPFEDGSFDRVFEVNSFHHWPSPAAGLAEIRRVLRDGGALQLCLRRKHPTRTFLVAPGCTEEEIQRVTRLVGAAGFRNVRVRQGKAGRKVACVAADR